jgi:hypothetical protein
MKMMIGETASHSLAIQAKVHRQLGGPARLELAFQLSELTRALALAGLRARLPSGSEAELRQ